MYGTRFLITQSPHKSDGQMLLLCKIAARTETFHVKLQTTDKPNIFYIHILKIR
jgi:hypothetical protein